MTSYHYVKATPELVATLAPRIRQEDVEEVWASGHEEIEPAILSSCVFSRRPTVALVNGVPECVFGVAQTNFLSDEGHPWFLSSEILYEHKKEFWKRSQQYFTYITGEFSRLENHVDARNTRAIQWLEKLGFNIDDPEPFGPDHVPFHRFHWGFN